MKYTKVAIIGTVDVGKTSLLETLGGQKITTKELRGITQGLNFEILELNSINELIRNMGYTFEAKKSIVLIDTPGHHSFKHLKKVILSTVDCVLVLVEALKNKTLTEAFYEIPPGIPIIIGVSKLDLVSNVDFNLRRLEDHYKINESWISEVFWNLPEEIINRGFDFFWKNQKTPIIPFSTKKNFGLLELILFLQLQKNVDTQILYECHATKKQLEGVIFSQNHLKIGELLSDGTNSVKIINYTQKGPLWFFKGFGDTPLIPGILGKVIDTNFNEVPINLEGVFLLAPSEYDLEALKEVLMEEGISIARGLIGTDLSVKEKILLENTTGHFKKILIGYKIKKLTVSGVTLIFSNLIYDIQKRLKEIKIERIPIIKNNYPVFIEFLGPKYVFKKTPLTVGMEVKGELTLDTPVYYNQKKIKIISIMDGAQILEKISNAKVAIRFEGLTLSELEGIKILIGGYLPLTFTEKEKNEYRDYLYHLPN